MPFQNSNVYHFNQVTINTVNEVGGVYGLAKAQVQNLGYYTVLYVGKSVNLRKRLQEHLTNPPVAGITHFFADRVDTEAERTQREAQLIAEFKPVGNTQLK